MKQAFGSVGGKSALASRLLKLFPEHKIYIEAFAGGAACFFAKERSEKEILNDIDKEIAFAYRFMQTFTDEELEQLKKKDWIRKRELFEKLKELEPQDRVDRFYKFIYLRKASYGSDAVTGFAPSSQGEKINFVSSLPQYKRRLKGVKILNRDFRELLEFDSEDTFWFLDPPYSSHWGRWHTPREHREVPEAEEVRDFLKKLRGKFLLTYETEASDLFSDFNVRKIQTRATLDWKDNRSKRFEILVSNYPLEEKNSEEKEERKGLRFRAKIEKIEGNKIFYSLPSRVFSYRFREVEEPMAVDPASLKQDFIEMARSVYIGSKRRIKETIVNLVPDEVRTVFDPMCGFSSVLRALAERGKEVFGNDLNLIAYYYSRALFLKKKPSEKEVEEFISKTEKREGYFSKSNFWPAAKIPLTYKSFIDGFILKARESEYPRFYLGVIAGYLSRVINAFGGPYDAEKVGNFRITELKEDLKNEAEDLLKCEATGKITCFDALQMEIPKVDLIYFDPPYIEGNPNYFKRYAKANSILLQRDWEIPRQLKKEDIETFGKKLQNFTDLLIISSSADCPISWGEILKIPRRKVYRKTIKVKGTGLKNAAESLNQRIFQEQIWISVRESLAEIAKAGDPFMIYPPENETYKYIIQTHFRGKTVHLDLRIENLQKKFLIGWTILAQREGAIKKPVLTMKQAKEINANSEKYFKIDFQTGEWAKRKKTGMKPGHYTNISIVATRKAIEPLSWENYEGVTARGTVGATKNYPGVFCIVDRGTAEYGSQKTWLHEYFFNGKVLKRSRYFFRQLKAWKRKGTKKELTLIENEGLWNHIKELNKEALKTLQDEGMKEDEIKQWILQQLREVQEEMNLSEEEISKAFILPPGKEEGLGPELGWLFIKPIDQTPYVLSTRAREEGWLPPKGFSALPKIWREKVKLEERYWEKDGQEALEAREKLYERWKEEGIFKLAESGIFNPFESKKELEISEARNPLQADFRITYQWWRGPIIVRLGPSRYRYHIWFKFGKKILDFSVNDNILEVDKTGGILYTDRRKEDFEKTGFVKPGTLMNPTKATPSFIKLLDKGKAEILIDNPKLKKVKFDGSKLKGMFLFVNVEDYWSIKRVAESPGKAR